MDDEASRPTIERQSGAPDDAGAGSDGWVEPPEEDAEDGSPDGSQAGESESVQVPRKFRDAKEGRESMSLVVDDKSNIRDVRHEMENRFGDDVRKLDIHAAIMAAGAASPSKVEQVLADYGYGKDIE